MYVLYHILQNNGRKIQTLGTPWQGTPVMGMTADIADQLGFGCGDNPAFGVGTASRWLKKVPRTAQSQVYYYTTESVRNEHNTIICDNYQCFVYREQYLVLVQLPLRCCWTLPMMALQSRKGHSCPVVTRWTIPQESVTS